MDTDKHKIFFMILIKIVAQEIDGNRQISIADDIQHTNEEPLAKIRFKRINRLPG